MPDSTVLSPWSPLVLCGAQVRTLQAGGRAYRISLWQPPGPAPSTGWPAIYLLDAGPLFATFAGALQRLSARPEGSGIAPVLLVGIEPDGAGEARRAARWRDFTAGPCALEDTPAPAVGGARDFLATLAGQVIPGIEREFPVDAARRGLFGHSLAGYFTLWSLAARPQTFAYYFAISPSIWWDADSLRMEAVHLAALERSPRVYLAAGQWEGAPAPWQRSGADAAWRARRERRRMIGNARQYADRLGCLLTPEAVRFDLLADEDHGSVVLPAIGRALRFMLGPE